MNCKVIQGDCRDVLKELIEQGVQVDSIVTDPPYELGFMGKGWDKTGIATDVEMWKLALQVLKPGGHLLAFGGSRTYHRMASAIEDSGFEIRDQIMWIYGQGFPKSLDISKAIDKKAGVEREVVGKYIFPDGVPRHYNTSSTTFAGSEPAECKLTKPTTNLAKQWQGWGTGLKPAHEPIVMARKPISEKTIADNVVVHGTGAINIDGSRVEVEDLDKFQAKWDCIQSKQTVENVYRNNLKEIALTAYKPTGRFPANLIHDGSEEVEEEFAKYGNRPSGAIQDGAVVNHTHKSVALNKLGDFKMAGTTAASSGTASRFFYCAKASKEETERGRFPANLIHDGSEEVEEEFAKYGEKPSGGGDRNSKYNSYFTGLKTTELPQLYSATTGTASRFFYCAKASKKDRQGSKHPTVKPIALMRYLCKLITPPEGIVLDPFAGTGTTGEAAHLEGFESILIEREAEYVADINRRIEAMGFKLRG